MTNWQPYTLRGCFSHRMRGRIGADDVSGWHDLGAAGGLASGWMPIERSGAYALCRPPQPQRRDQALAGHHGPSPACFPRHVPPVGLVPAWMVSIPIA